MMAESVTFNPMPPTTASYVIASTILAGVVGFFIGQGSTLGIFSSPASVKSSRRWLGEDRSKTAISQTSSDNRESNPQEELSEDDERDEGEQDDDDEELAAFPGNHDEVKLVLVVRTDLGMGKGKIAAQCSHATLACYKYYLSKAPNSPILRRWERGGQAKVALQVKTEEEMLLLQAQAVSLGLCARVIQDAGRTQIASGSRTVLGILGPKSIVDTVTGHLKLL